MSHTGCKCGNCKECLIDAYVVKTCLLIANRLEVTEGQSNFHGDVTVDGNILLNGSELINGDLTVTGVTNFTGSVNLPYAPALITVNKTAVANGNTVFNSIQSAIESLHGKPILDTTISVAPDTYIENITFQNLIISDETKLKLVGDTRDIAGLGIAHDSFWNATAIPGVIGGGIGSRAVLAAVGADTISVTAAVGISPNFIAAGIVAGDRVIIRDNAGVFTTYTVKAGGVGANTLALAPNIVGAIGGVTLGSAISFLPNVTITAPIGPVISQKSNVTIKGFFIDVPAGQIGLYGNQNSTTRFINNTISGGAWGINNSLTTVTFVAARDDPRGTYIYSDSPIGFTIFNSSIACINLIDGTFVPEGALFAPENAKVGILIQTTTLFSGLYGLRAMGNVCIQGQQASKVFSNAPYDLICTGGGAFSGGISVQQRSFINMLGPAAGNGSINIRGVPVQGIFMGASFINSSGGSFVSMSTTSTAAFIGLTMSGLAGDSCAGNISFGNLNIPANAGSLLARISDGSMLGVRASPVGVSQIVNCTAFQVQTGSTLVWRGAGAVGNFAGNNVANTRLFDIQTCSVLVIPSSAVKTFSGYPVIYNFDDNSKGFISSATSTTTIGGTNLNVTDMSNVELDSTVTFNVSGANTGVTTSFGGYVGTKLGALFTNFATTKFNGGVQRTNDPIGSYTATYQTGTIVLNPGQAL